ncbi:hypothetical protein L615_007500000010 [Nocardioides sp. J9]|uniref:hypothetical protein n=1 Tax=Nocardioides sp. J9 TaxID=935844 RepID=UPI00119CFD9B|nr:hypothetical protein [Nocardioides sp. J9]TWG91991.1 hypothetical protein L615_007500000010 [Nocardioides sp. J9]
MLDLGEGLSATIAADDNGLYRLGASTSPGPGRGFVAVVSGPVAALDAWWASDGLDPLLEDWPGITVAITQTDAGALGMLGKVDEVPVTVGAGWTCEWFLADDSASCTRTDGTLASLVVRDAADRDAWLADPDKGATPDAWVTEAHDGIFISVQAGSNATPEDVEELGRSLTWVD